MIGKIVFQGELGVYGYQVCVDVCLDYEFFFCVIFEDVINVVCNGDVDFGMIVVENLIYGCVVDVYLLLLESGLYIVDEVFVCVNINLLGVKGVMVDQVIDVYGYVVILL